MNIVRIIVDELPDKYKEEVISSEITILVSTKNIRGTSTLSHLYSPNCLLEVENDTCKWAYSRDNHPNITYKSTHEIDLYIPIHTKGTVNYCPSCGKKIEYKEE